MKILGPYLMGTLEQRTLIAGAAIDLPRDHRLLRHLIEAEIGDLLWVKEPWAHYHSGRQGPQHIAVAVPGPVGTPPPDKIKAIALGLKISPMSALSLARVDTRCTLEIMSIGEHSVRCLVHMVQVDKFLKARAA